MGHPAIENQTPFAFELLFVQDDNGQPVLAPIVKATYEIRDAGAIVPAETQIAVNLEGEFTTKEPQSSYKYAPDSVFFKPATDVALIGHAFAPAAAATEIIVNFAVGPVRKSIQAFGDRFWCTGFGGAFISDPEPFETIPLVYERAFGGWDRSHRDPSRHSFEPRNPVGTGFRGKNGNVEDGLRLPNLEDPKYPIHKWTDTPPPAGFGFTSPNWHPRAAYAGTYDDKWMANRMPLLPADFDRRFYNAASPDLIAPGYLRGDEPVICENVSPEGLIRFDLPGTPPPVCEVEFHGRKHRQLDTKLDTVVVNTDERLLVPLWRTYLPLKNGPHDVAAIKLKAE